MEGYDTPLAGKHLTLELVKALLVKGALLPVLYGEAHLEAVGRSHQDLAPLA